MNSSSLSHAELGDSINTSYQDGQLQKQVEFSNSKELVICTLEVSETSIKSWAWHLSISKLLSDIMNVRRVLMTRVPHDDEIVSK